MNSKTAQYLEETDKFIKDCHKGFIDENPFLSGNEYEVVRRYHNFLLTQLDITQNLVEKGGKNVRSSKKSTKIGGNH